MRTNTTCDIYRFGAAPPTDPSVAAVKIFLEPNFEPSHEVGIGAGAGITTAFRWTHVALFPLGADIRDGYVTGTPNAEGAAANWDTVYVPNKNGTPFTVIFAERIGYGTGSDFKKVYLQRGTPPWPTNNI